MCWEEAVAKRCRETELKADCSVSEYQPSPLFTGKAGEENEQGQWQRGSGSESELCIVYQGSHQPAHKAEGPCLVTAVPQQPAQGSAPSGSRAVSFHPSHRGSYSPFPVPSTASLSHGRVVMSTPLSFCFQHICIFFNLLCLLIALGVHPQPT